MPYIFNLEKMKQVQLPTTRFSSIDLQTKIDAETTGIVFPFKDTTAEYHPSFSSIVKIKDDMCYIACSEYRIITHNSETNYANYTLMPSVTFSTNKKQESVLNNIFGYSSKSCIHVITAIDLENEDYLAQQDIKTLYNFLEDTLKTYEPTILVDSTHLTQNNVFISNEFDEEFDEEFDDYETLKAYAEQINKNFETCIGGYCENKR